MKTNLTPPLAVGLSTNWITIPGSQTNTSIEVPVSAPDPSAFYRMLYPAP